jgi:hypothetical protein
LCFSSQIAETLNSHTLLSNPGYDHNLNEMIGEKEVGLIGQIIRDRSIHRSELLFLKEKLKLLCNMRCSVESLLNLLKNTANAMGSVFAKNQTAAMGKIAEGQASYSINMDKVSTAANSRIPSTLSKMSSEGGREFHFQLRHRSHSTLAWPN